MSDCGCSWDGRESDRIHRCSTVSQEFPVGSTVAAAGRDGGEIRGVVVKIERGPAGVIPLVLWRGAYSPTPFLGGGLRVVDGKEAA